MEMIATSDCTALIAMNITARMATLNGAAPVGAVIGLFKPKARPIITKIKSGTSSVPTNPIGSRAKILVSSHVSFQNPRNTLLGIVSP